jgi:hypothetical protein
MNTHWHERINGTIEVQPLVKPTVGSREFLDKVSSRSRYVWRPPYQISKLPSWFELALDCCTTTSGIRRFTPIDLSADDLRANSLGLQNVATGRGLSLVASIGGYRLMLDRGDVRRDFVLTHDESRLYLQHIEHRQEYFGKRKGLELGLPRAQPDFTNGILPYGLGLGPEAKGKPWTRAQFENVGLDAARAAGIQRPDKRQIQSYGLTEAAKLNPLNIRSSSGRAAVVRMVLFALPQSTKNVTHDQLRYVAAHVRKSLSEHLNDTDEQFAKWIADPDSNLLHRIQKRSDCKLSRQQVKHVLLELGWQALQMVGKCIDVQMRAFRDAIFDPLTDIEKFYFDQLFLADASYAGLPLLLMHDRYDELKAAVLNVWNNPGDRTAVPVLHRVMTYYSEVLGNRRKADKEYKQASLARNVDGLIACSQSLDIATLAQPGKRDGGLLLEIAKHLAREHGIDCDFGEWEATANQVSNKIRVELRRADPSFVKTITISLAEFEKIAEIVRESNEP